VDAAHNTLDVEVFFSIISRQAIHRGSFSSVRDLIAAIRTFIDAWNDRCEPFVDQGGRRDACPLQT
jgi:hypothetical protein